jgi:short-subunit dehydrogenase
MEDLRGANALLTGAAGGIGGHIARALAGEGMNLVLSGRNVEALEKLRAELEPRGIKAVVVAADLSDLSEVDPLAERAEAAVGPLDLLVNNAGVELSAPFTKITREELELVVAVNLRSPMLLIHRMLPGMLDRGRGHVVNIASLAGKIGPPYGEPYAATKAGLIGLTQSLRAEYDDSAVGFSVVCPGFVAGGGMYTRAADAGVKAPAMLGESDPDKVPAAVVRAIVKDEPEIIVNPRPVRPLLALGAVSPRLGERVLSRMGIKEWFLEAARSQGRG